MDRQGADEEDGKVCLYECQEELYLRRKKTRPAVRAGHEYQEKCQPPQIKLRQLMVAKSVQNLKFVLSGLNPGGFLPLRKYIADLKPTRAALVVQRGHNLQGL